MDEFIPLLVKMLGKSLNTISELTHTAIIDKDEMTDLRQNLAKSTVYNPDKKIEHVLPSSIPTSTPTFVSPLHILRPAFHYYCEPTKSKQWSRVE